MWKLFGSLPLAGGRGGRSRASSTHIATHNHTQTPQKPIENELKPSPTKGGVVHWKFRRLQCSVLTFPRWCFVCYGLFFGSTSLPQVGLRFFILWCSVRLTYMRPGCVVARALNSSNGNSHSWSETVWVRCPLDLLVRDRFEFGLFGFSGVFLNVDFRIRFVDLFGGFLFGFFEWILMRVRDLDCLRS